MLPFLERMILAEEPSQLISRLKYTPFDTLMVIHLADGTYESRYHVDGKFFTPVLNGDYSQLVTYASGHMVHPDDRDAHLRLMDPLTMEKRMAEATPEGVLGDVIRYLGMDGHWHRMQHLLIGGKAFGLTARDVYDYAYDVQDILSRELVQHKSAQAASERMRNWVPQLLTEASFFSLCDDLIAKNPGNWCMISVDIRHYKLFMDLNGEEKGERLLVRFGEILHQTAERSQGLACYCGQDDFGLFIPFDKAGIDRLFSELRAEIEALSSISGFYPILGICRTDEEKVDAMELFNRAALTGEEIRDDLRYHIRVYDSKLHERHVEEFRLLADFKEAIGTDAITFVVQPQVHVKTGRIIGAESLARWQGKDGNFISPDRFVPLLEKYGAVTDLDMRIWENVCAWLRDLINRRIRPVPISINVSRVDIHSMDVPAILTGLTEKYHLMPDLLKVEITEAAYGEDSLRMSQTVAELQERGFKVMMDDFGSGYSSLNMLRTISVDAIKLDAQFLRFSPGEEEKGINIIESMVNMTKSLSTPIIVEGVETQELVRFLQDLGCRYIQGYYYYRPMSSAQFEDLLKDPALMDYEGIVVQRNQQMHTREFLDEKIYSDAMLNNILGPVAFYALRDQNVDIIRYNEQFVDMIGLDAATMEGRRYHIQRYFHPDDLGKFFEMLSAAEKDRINGANGIFRVYKPNGTIFWMRLQVYLLQEETEGKVFYGSARDMTELQYINQDLPGGYYRSSLRQGYELLYISDTLLKMLGYTREEIRTEFGNELARMIHPEDRDRVWRESREIITGTRDNLQPYRILHRDGTYRYVLDQSRLTDQYGELCWQAVMVDITEVMILRNRMRLLEKFSTDCILFLRDLTHLEDMELGCYGLEEKLGIDKDEFLKEMLTGEISLRDALGRELINEMKECDPARVSELNGLYLVTPAKTGQSVPCHLRFSRITDPTQDVEFIMSLSAASGQPAT